MSFEETSDSADLCEYDSYTSSYTEHGIPLSVELSESLCASQTPVSETSSNFFVKAPEIFLRFDSSITDLKTIVSQVSEQNTENNVPQELKTISFNPEEKNDINICDNCVELQYEDEFENPSNEIDDCSAEVLPKRSNSLDNEYEELFLEGTI